MKTVIIVLLIVFAVGLGLMAAGIVIGVGMMKSDKEIAAELEEEAQAMQEVRKQKEEKQKKEYNIGK